MRLVELTMPLRHHGMPDEALPTAVRFFLGPKDHAEKGIVIGSETGTCLVLPSIFAEFRRTERMDRVAPEKLTLRATAVLTVHKKAKEEIGKRELEQALDTAGLSRRDAVLVRTGWGDLSRDCGASGRYLLDTPHFSFAGAGYLAERMAENESDLLLTDTALIGWPGKHLVPEWSSLIPSPPPESGEARMYLHLYDTVKMAEDFAVEREFARRGIMTVRKLDRCGELNRKRIRIIVAPLQVVRGVASTCRVVALEDAP